MRHDVIDFAHNLGLFEDYWSPRVIAEMNDYQFKLVKLRGEFVWHDHRDTDETFILFDARLRIELCDRQVVLEAGEMYVVPKGVEHRSCTEGETSLLLIEARGVVNTGASGGALQAANDRWV